jgi:hypothetical protein
MINKAQRDYYDVSFVVGNDIYIVAMLLATIRSDISIQIVRDLEKLKVEKYSKELDILNDMSIQTLKNIATLLAFKSEAFQEKHSASLST